MHAEEFYRLYDVMLSGIQSEEKVEKVLAGEHWSVVLTKERFGMAMTTEGNTVSPMFTSDYKGLTLRELAQAVKSWNLKEAGFGMAAVNAFYNTKERLEVLDCAEPFENYCTEGLDLKGKKIGVVGHMNMPDYVKEQAKEICFLERAPKPGDYPDSACDWLLPQCDIVLITGSTLVNKTLPHLLELCQDAYTILCGPSVPMCPKLLEYGIDRLAGLVITDKEHMMHKIVHDVAGSPYPYGTPFLLRGTR